MGINMDTRSTLDYEFMNLDNVDENTASEIRAILSTDITSDVLKLPWDHGDKDFNSNSVVPEMQHEVHWQPYDEALQAYDVSSTTPSLLTPISGMAYTAGAIMQVPYPDWQMSGYPGSPTADQAYAYVSSVAYPSTMYQTGPATDVLSTQSPTREDRRANGRRSRKTDTYNRVINQNDIQPSYMMQQNQFNQMQAICHPGVPYLPYVSSPQHPSAARPIFVPSHQYASISIHHNNPQTQYQPMPPAYQHQHSPTMKHRNAQTYPMYNQDKTQSHAQLQKNDKNLYDNQHTGQTFRPTVNHNKSNHPRNARHNASSQNDEGKEKEVKKSERVALIHPDNKTNGIVNGDKSDETKVHNDQTNQIGNDHGNQGNVEEEKDSVKTEVEAVVKVEHKVVGKVEGKVTKEETKVVTKEETKVIKENVKVEVSGKIEEAKTNGQNQKDEKVMVKVEEEVKVEPAPSGSAVKTFASILKNTSAGPPPGFIQYQAPTIKLPTVRANATSSVNNGGAERAQQVNKKVEEDKADVVGQHCEEQGNVVEGGHAERKSLPVDQVENPWNHPRLYRMAEFLLTYQMDKQTVSLLPRGLTNRSNYCYINSILQALLACSPFYNLLMALPYVSQPSKNSSTPLLDNMIKFVNEFMPVPEGERLPRDSRKDRGQKKNDDTFDVKGGNAFEPSYVYTMLQNTASAGVFSIEGRQEDAEEFLSCLLNGLSDEMLEVMKQVNDHSKNPKRFEDLNLSSSGDEEWKVMGPKNKGSITRCTQFERTPLSDIFRGQLRSRILRQGDQSTDNVQPFFTLQLDIEKAESVKAALEILVGKDQVEGMTCSKTKQQIQAWKQVTLEELPVVLILHLKWFDYKLDECSKIFKNVTYAIDLKIDPKLLSPNAMKKLTPKQKQYKLFAVTYHDGKEATKGHYVTDAFHVGFGAWVRYDDSSVKGISENDVLNPSPPRVPYLLYYRRCDTIGNQPNNPRTR